MKGLDLARLQTFLGSPRALTARMFTGGRSNLTYAVTDGEQRWVLRRPPLGHVLPTAHDMAREHRVLSALSAAGFPVPRPVLLCTDTTVIGAPFYLMDHVEGAIYRDLSSLEPSAVRQLILSLVDTLATLHAFDPAQIGLADFGRAEGFNQRQVVRWKKQLDASRSRSVVGIDELHARLAVDVPAGGPGAVVHGDFRLDNVLVGPPPSLPINAVLDWEMSTLGDPLSDVALMLIYAGLPLNVGGAAVPLAVPGHPTLAEMSARYAERSGRDVSDLHWYVGFAAFKLAVILEGVHYRYVHGQTVGEGFEKIGDLVGPLVMRGHEALEGN